uniref:Si:ch73-74h11.1 n=1 Tax=Astyanax mexicanus TaxID=7994 RepID=A0A8B9KST3_ASTMX
MTYLWFGRLCLLLILYTTVASKTIDGSRRKKREWILPPTKLAENVDYTKKPFVAKIRSDKHLETTPVEYSLTGHGADKEPFNLFVVNPKNGFVRITGILDREEISQYNLTGIARYRDGSLAESDIKLKIQVEDQNDNPPNFRLFKGTVKECSKIGTPVMQIKADDADEPGTINAKIAYSIVKQIPEQSGGMFSINRDTGEIYVKQHTLDRETLDSYTLIVQGVDMDGAANGKTGTGTVQIKVSDINDNVPTLEKDEYSGDIDEGAIDVVVMRIKALDKDLENTDNWLAHFEIAKGNEDELFTIETDPKTNEGILKLVKPVDYEKVKVLDLGLVISNVAPFINGTSYPVSISVNNLPDGPGFSPTEKDFPVSENPEELDIPMVIGSFPALDGDTGELMENVRYAKGHDPDNWLAIDEETSEIKLVKMPDRESKFLVNGTYFAKIICMTQDVPPKTATGTIALKVQDANDHCPELTSTYQSVCSDTKIINVTAFDEDVDPNGEPYKFVLIEEETRGKWEMVPVNGTTVSFHAQELLWPGFYELTVEIYDVKGLGCEDKQKLQVEVCTCEKSGTCGSRSKNICVINNMLGVAGILSVVPIFLLFCKCGSVGEFTELPFDAKEYLISYHTEGMGEDKPWYQYLQDDNPRNSSNLIKTSEQNRLFDIDQRGFGHFSWEHSTYSSNKCMFLTNVASKKQINRLSNGM